MNKNNKIEEMVQILFDTYKDRTDRVFQRKEIISIGDKQNWNYSQYAGLFNKENQVARGKYDLSSFDNNTKTKKMTINFSDVSTSVVNESCFIPEMDEFFVPWGPFNDLVKIIKSEQFYPVYISGLSGNGKSFMVKQACAKAKRKYIRVQLTPETDSDDLIGGFRLIDGNTVFSKGPVIRAMEEGAVLLLDELDRASSKIMCLQGVLEGEPILIKKTGEVVYPQPGFTVFATANTKGQGSEDGRYISANIIDDAFLERFNIAIDQEFPNRANEIKIIHNHMKRYNNGEIDKDFADKLSTWSECIRKTFFDDGVDELISTRRLCQIVHTWAIFNNRLKAIKLCITRFDEESRDSFLDLYTKIDADIEGMKEENNITQDEE